MRYLCLFVFWIVIISCQSGAKENHAKGDDTAHPETENVSEAFAGNSFSLLAGTVGKYPVTSYLFARQHKYSGYYYYNSKEKPIEFSGDDTTQANRLVLTAYTSEDSMETFTLSVSGNAMTGNWSLNGQSLPVSLSKADMPVQFSYTRLQDSVALSDTLPNAPKATAEESTVWPTGNSVTDAFIKKQIARLFDNKNPRSSLPDMLQSNAKGFLADYKNEDITQEEISESPESLNYEQTNDLRVAYLSPKLLVLSFYNYGFTGGAHGNFATSYITLDIENCKVLTLTDIINATGMKQLRPLLERNYRREKHLTPTQSLEEDGGLLVKKIEPNDNFYITGKGLIFSYAPYEIAPYAAGEIALMIDHADLQPYLQPAFTHLLP